MQFEMESMSRTGSTIRNFLWLQKKSLIWWRIRLLGGRCNFGNQKSGRRVDGFGRRLDDV